MKLLALSGSLRDRSYNLAALEVLQVLAPNSVEINIGDISQLPLFNPDLESEIIPAVENLKVQLLQASGLIIASPEYAHGISGPMKNALDWLVSGEEFPAKPIMLINTSPRATHAMLALEEVLNTMSGNIIESANVLIPLLGSGFDKESILENGAITDTLKYSLFEFISCINEKL